MSARPDLQAVCEELERLLEKATPGDWRSTATNPADGGEWFWITACPAPNQEREIGTVSGPQNERNTANADLIVAAKQHLPALLSYVRGMEEAAKAVLEALSMGPLDVAAKYGPDAEDPLPAAAERLRDFLGGRAQ